MGRISDLQDKDQNVSIDVDFKIIGSILTVTDFQLFESVDDNWIEVLDKKRARELYNKYHGDNLILKYFENKPEPYFTEVAS